MTKKHGRNRFWIVLIAISMACAIALPAGAAPPKCDTDPASDLQGCKAPVDDEPLAGTTCRALGEWGQPFDSDFTVTLTESACIDVIATAGVWTVDIDENPDGTLRWLGLVIRDSIAPGDACDSVSYRRDVPSRITLDGFESDGNPGIAGAWVNSCGTDWAELVGDTYHADEDTKVASPLVLQVLMSGKDAEVTLTIHIP
jgi:hypothetical protein